MALAVCLLAPLLGALPATPAAAATTSLSQVFRNDRVYGTYNSGAGPDEVFSSPGVADVTGDGAPDIVVATMDGRIRVLNVFGQEVTSITVDGSAMIHGSPVLVDLNGDGTRDVLVGTMPRSPANGTRSYVRGYDVRHGNALIFDQSNQVRSDVPSGFLGTPAVGDIDGDGQNEIVVAGNDQRLYAWNLNGTSVPGFPTYTFDTSWSSPVIADIDGDGQNEVVWGGDMADYPNRPINPATGRQFSPGGLLLAVNGDGSWVPGYPKELSGETLYSSPAVVDLDGDGDLDIVIGTGNYFWATRGSTAGFRLYAVDGATGGALPGFPVAVGGVTFGSPAVGDIDGDGRPEIVFATSEGRLRAVDHDGNQKWSTCVMNFTPCGQVQALLTSPVLADVDGDGQVEAVVGGEHELRVLNAATGALEARGDMGASWMLQASPTVASVNGKAWIVANMLSNTANDGRRGVGDAQSIFAWTTGAPLGAAPWPTFHRTMGRDGAIDDGYRPTMPRYITAAYTDLIGRAPSPGEIGFWAPWLAAGGDRKVFTLSLARSDEWTRYVVGNLYRDVLGRPGDPGGVAYWAGRLQAGMTLGEVAAALYGSDEYFAAQGGTNGGFIDALYAAILHRAPDPNGRAYWIGRFQSGVPRHDLSFAIFQSQESREARVEALYQKLLGRSADGGGKAHWAGELQANRGDDVVLAADLSASQEYVSRSLTRF